MSLGHPHGHAPGHDASHAEPHGHAHDAEHQRAAHGAGGSLRRLAWSLGLTATVMVAEAVGGVLSGSRPADDKRTFGFRRAEVLAAQINVGALLVLSVWIGWEAVGRLTAGGHPIDLKLMAVMAGIGLAANLAILRFLQHEPGLNARSAFLHVLADTVSSVAILAGAGVMAMRPELWWLDPVLSVLIAALILWGAVRLVLEITEVLMESVPRHLDLAEVTRLMESADGVIAVHDLHIWTISSGMYALSAHVVVHADAVGQNDAILTAVKGRLRRACGIDHTTIQIESADYAHVDDVHTH